MKGLNTQDGNAGPNSLKDVANVGQPRRRLNDQSGVATSAALGNKLQKDLDGLQKQYDDLKNSIDQGKRTGATSRMLLDGLRQEIQSKKRQLAVLDTRQEDGTDKASPRDRMSGDAIRVIRNKPANSLNSTDVDAINKEQGMDIHNTEELKHLIATLDNLQMKVDDLPLVAQTVDPKKDIEPYRNQTIPSFLLNARKFLRGTKTKVEAQTKALNALLGEDVVNSYLSPKKKRKALRMKALTAQKELYKKNVSAMGDKIHEKNLLMANLAHSGTETDVMLYDLLQSMRAKNQTPGAVYIEAPAGLRLHESPAKAVGAWLQDSGGIFSAKLAGVLMEAERLGWEIVPVDATQANAGAHTPDANILSNSGVPLSENADLVGRKLQGNVPRQNYIARNVHAYATKNPNRGGILLMGSKHFADRKGGRLREMLTDKPVGGYEDDLLLNTWSANAHVVVANRLKPKPGNPSYQNAQGIVQK